MTERQLEQRLEAWFQAELGSDRASPSLVDRVASIPEQSSPAAGWFAGGRRGVAIALLVILLATALLGGAMALGSRLVPVPSVFEHVPPDPASFDVCALLRNGDLAPVAGANLRFSSDGHDILPAAEGETCVLGWDDRYSRPHLIFRTEPTSASEAAAIRDRVFVDDGVAWREVKDGVWSGGGAESDGRGAFGAAAVSWEPYFFILTAPTSDEALAGASRILDALVAAAGGQ